MVPVNIVYPIPQIYPVTVPPSGPLDSAYLPASFSVTCERGLHRVEWGFDGDPPLGTAGFFDEISVQFVHQLQGGSHIFWVRSDCGEDRVEFRIGA